MKFKTIFALVACYCIGFSTCNPSQAISIAEFKNVLAESKSRTNLSQKDDVVNLLPAFEAIFGLIDMDAALELVGHQSPCGRELREYLQGNFSYVIDDFYAEPGIMAVFEYINDNGFDPIYTLIGLLHLILGMKLPPFPYPTAKPQINEDAQLGLFSDTLNEECTPEDQEIIAEIVSRMIPIWKMLELILELLAIDHSFVSLIMRIREPDVIAGYQSFIMKESAIDLGNRMEAEGVNPRLVLALWNIFFGLNRAK